MLAFVCSVCYLIKFVANVGFLVGEVFLIEGLNWQNTIFRQKWILPLVHLELNGICSKYWFLGFKASFNEMLELAKFYSPLKMNFGFRIFASQSNLLQVLVFWFETFVLWKVQIGKILFSIENKFCLLEICNSIEFVANMGFFFQNQFIKGKSLVVELSILCLLYLGVICPWGQGGSQTTRAMRPCGCS
jgi:hypothetical protein